jgi:hypothetical protein
MTGAGSSTVLVRNSPACGALSAPRARTLSGRCAGDLVWPPRATTLENVRVTGVVPVVESTG